MDIKYTIAIILCGLAWRTDKSGSCDSKYGCTYRYTGIKTPVLPLREMNSRREFSYKPALNQRRAVLPHREAHSGRGLSYKQVSNQHRTGGNRGGLCWYCQMFQHLCNHQYCLGGYHYHYVPHHDYKHLGFNQAGYWSKSTLITAFQDPYTPHHGYNNLGFNHAGYWPNSRLITTWQGMKAFLCDICMFMNHHCVSDVCGHHWDAIIKCQNCMNLGWPVNCLRITPYGCKAVLLYGRCPNCVDAPNP